MCLKSICTMSKIITSAQIIKNTMADQTQSYINKHLHLYVNWLMVHRNKENGFIDVSAIVKDFNTRKNASIKIEDFERNEFAQDYSIEVSRCVQGDFNTRELAGIKPKFNTREFGTIKPFDENVKHSKKGKYGYIEYHPLLASKLIGWLDVTLDVIAHALLLDKATMYIDKLILARKRFNELFSNILTPNQLECQINYRKNAYNYLREDALGINGKMAEDFVGDEESQLDMLQMYDKANLLIEEHIVNSWEDFKDRFRPDRLKN